MLRSFDGNLFTIDPNHFFGKNAAEDAAAAEYFATAIKKYVARHPCVVDFYKVNGERRLMLCTTNPELIPASPSSVGEGKVLRPKPANVVPAYDLVAEGWRSFRIDHVFSIWFNDKASMEEMREFHSELLRDQADLCGNG